MIKVKLLKIAPYWLIALVFVIALQMGTFLFFSSPNITTADIQPAIPEVLGATTSLRGEIPSKTSELELFSAPDPSAVKAKSFVVFDLDTGTTLFGKNTGQRLQIASLTKLMTAFVTYQTTGLNQSFIVGQNDTLNVSPDLGLKAGDTVKTADVFDAMLIGSCNDAAKALAGYVSRTTGENFIDLMNRQALNFGMNNTKFSNPMGFDSVNNYSTADDLKLLIAATQKLSAFTSLGRRNGFQFTSGEGNIYTATATNKLLQTHPNINAIKTGYTNEAHGAMATEVLENGHRVAILVLDSKNREGDTLDLKDQLEKVVSR
ncbi:MAG: hypothetical protein P4L74_05115 [Candidatus Doudnabacteria bacterium]|nr:hypothetical protein [Candidatus Doudnabacteria bacterium]